MLAKLLITPLFMIQNPGNYPVNEKKLIPTIHKAIAHFEQELGPVTTPVKISISPPDCLRTGYNRRTRVVVFCPNQIVKNAGLDSVDVINHELFHALLCELDQNLCESDAYDYLHEGLADTFSYQLNPDGSFGEDFYHAHPYIRTYTSTWRVGLVKTEHEKGTALASAFIREKKDLRSLLALFRAEVPKDEVTVEVEGREVSRLNRYRIRKGEALRLSLVFHPDAKVAAVKWITPAGVAVEQQKGFHFHIRVQPEMKQNKTLAIFLAGDGRELGRYSFYFGPEISTSEK